jgi:two-component system, NtrC family, sensor kinase
LTGSKSSMSASGTGCYAIGETGGDGLNLELFRQWFGNFPDPVMVMDVTGGVAYLNDSAQRLTGCFLSQESRLPCDDILRSDANDKEGSLIEKCLEGKNVSEVRVRLRNQVGEWQPFSLSAQSVRDAEGKPAACVAIMRGPLSGSPGAEISFMGPIVCSIINNFPMPFFTANTHLTITYMNDHLEKLTGYSSSEVVGRMTCAELFRTAHCHTKDCPIKEAMESRTPLAGLRRTILDREGRKIPVAVHASMITDAEQRVIGGFQALRDITPIIEAEQKISMLTEITQEGILMVDEDRRVIFANSKMAEILDQPKDVLIGKDVGELLPSQHLGIVHDLMQNADMEHPQQLCFCSTIQPAKTALQDFRIFETCIVLFRIGKSLTTYMFFHDLTKHIEVERQLYNANSFLNNIIKSSADGIVVVDTDGKMLIFNEGAERILGYSAEEVVGDSTILSRICSPEVAREMMRRMRTGEHGWPGKLTSQRVTLIAKNGEEVPVNFSAAIIKKEDREIGSVGIFSDLREQLKMRQDLEDARIQLLQSEKIASVGRLAAGVAHEINNPLSGILIYADLLKRDLADHPQVSEDLQEIITQTLRCKQIVTRLLEFSRQSVGQRIPFEINEFIKRSAELLTYQALFHNVELILDLQPDIPEIMGDPGQLQQVFTNLIINAGAAMNGKGRIVITSRFDPESERVSLQFADTGPGIPPEIMDKIFEPFFTTKRPGEGTGLGLSVAYGIIQQHGGSIEVKNAHTGGAIFTILLPLDYAVGEVEFTC